MSLLSLLIFSSAFSWAQGYIVGNGGDGFLKDGKVVLRDLQEAGLEETPFYGKQQDSDFAASVRMFPMAASLSDEFYSKLATKLTDLNLIYPQLGDVIFLGMRMYTWTLINTDLKRVPDDGELIEAPPGSEFVQLANRMGGTIRISKLQWERMNDDHRLALIFHETLYAMLIPKEVSPGVYSQSAMKAREIIAYFFSRDIIARGPAFFQKVVKNELNVEWDSISFNGPRNLTWTLEIQKTAPGEQPSRILRVITSQFNRFDRFLEVAKAFCAEMQKRKPNYPDAEVNMTSVVQLRDYRAEFTDYHASFGSQLALHFSPVTGPLERQLTVPSTVSPAVCEKSLRAHIDIMTSQL